MPNNYGVNSSTGGEHGWSYPVSVPYLSRICDYKGSTGLYITAVHNICGLLYLSRTVPIFVVLCIRLPDVEGDLERNRETMRKLN